jgi:putative transcriptional regulator
MLDKEKINKSRIVFGTYFKELRQDKQLTQQQVANFCEVSYQTINKIEQGKYPYSIDLLLKLSVILEFTINFQQKETGEPNRFLLQKSKREGFYSVTDTENQIVCSFEKSKFNDTQKFTFLNDTSHANLPTIMREFGEFLQNNHLDIV